MVLRPLYLLGQAFSLEKLGLSTGVKIYFFI